MFTCCGFEFIECVHFISLEIMPRNRKFGQRKKSTWSRTYGLKRKREDYIKSKILLANNDISKENESSEYFHVNAYCKSVTGWVCVQTKS